MLIRAYRRFAPLLWLLLPLCLVARAEASNSDLLQKVLDEGRLRCGVSKSIPGLAIQDKSGNWSGMDVDFCRALAAALFGSPDKARFVPLSAVERFPALLAGRVDLISGSTTWTLARELGLKVSFVGPIVFSSQRVLVKADSGITRFEQLQDTGVCVTRGTTHAGHLASYVAMKGMKLHTVPADSHVKARAALDAGKCSALSADEVALASLVPTGEAHAAYRILPDTISNEPLSAVLPAGNPGLERVVRWVSFMLIAAESNGIDQRTAASMQPGSPADAKAAAARRYGPPMGLSSAWADRAVAAVGNYGEMFARNLGAGSPIGLARGVNLPADQGGMLYAPPLH